MAAHTGWAHPAFSAFQVSAWPATAGSRASTPISLQASSFKLKLLYYYCSHSLNMTHIVPPTYGLNLSESIREGVPICASQSPSQSLRYAPIYVHNP